MSDMNIRNPLPETRSNSFSDHAIARASKRVSSPLSSVAEATGPGKQAVTFSSLAQQLSEAATRASARDASMTRQELATKGQHLTDIIVGNDYWAKKEHHDAEVPRTDDPVHLARAQQATNYTNQDGPNPFKGMSREQLSLITYDESGTFTVNERRAAWCEAYDQDEAQRRILVAKMEDEYNRTGKIADSLLDVLKFYKSLPAIDQAIQLPAVYEAQLEARILQGGSMDSREELSLLGLGVQWNFDQMDADTRTKPTLEPYFNAWRDQR